MGDVPATRRLVTRGRLAALAVLLVLAAAVLVVFEPQQLLLDTTVREALPAGPLQQGPDPAPAAAPAPATPPAPVVQLSTGSFVSRDHETAGTARLLELAPGRRLLRLEGLDTDNGPDVYVYLTANPADGPEQAFDDDHVSLGRLKGNKGDQNYEVPAGVDAARLRTVVLWCDRFNSAFGAADLA